MEAAEGWRSSAGVHTPTSLSGPAGLFAHLNVLSDEPDLQSFICSISLFLSTFRVCLVGNRTLRNDHFETCAKTQVVRNVTVTTDLWDVFCHGPNATCDNYFTLNEVSELQAIPGLLSGVIKGESALGPRPPWSG